MKDAHVGFVKMSVHVHHILIAYLVEMFVRIPSKQKTSNLFSDKPYSNAAS